MMDAVELYPSIHSGQSATDEGNPSEQASPMIPVSEPAAVANHASYQLFRKESIIATILIVLIGSAATYFASGYVLKPITTHSGDEFTADQMGDVTLFVFLDPNDPDAAAFYQALVDGYEGVKENGAEILVCTKSEDGNELFDNAPFPVILYNDSLKAATENHREMIEGVPNTASWCVNTSFLSAWFSSVEAE